MQELKKYILSQLGKGAITSENAVIFLNEMQKKENTDKHVDIAVIGMACRLPMADSVDEFWDNILNGRNCFTAKPAEKLLMGKPLANPYYAEFLGVSPYEDEAENLENFIGAYIKDIDKFDANFFGIPPREARFIEPGQRVFLEEAWKAIEDAGYCAESIKGSRTGVFAGKDNSNSLFYKYITEPDQMSTTGNWEGILASRISYLFNLKGPAMVVDTACSSGLVAVHEACAALRNKECDMALAGGVAMGAGSVTVGDDENDDAEMLVDSGSVLDNVRSNDNKVRTFDRKCSGTVFGEGVAVLMLKRLDDAVEAGDHIYAVIKGSAINNDGASNGITAPNPAAQEAVIMDAWKNAGIDPRDVSYTETHGTGTLLGDPIEVVGLTNAFSHYTNNKQFCGIGSVKTNIGHTVGTSGVASLLKVILAMKNGIIPPSIYFEEPNPNIDFVVSPLFVVDKALKWEDKNKRLIAGVNAFGFSGTNCHVVVEQYKTKETKKNAGLKIITVSAKTKNSVLRTVLKYRDFIEKEPSVDLERFAYTSNTGRGHYQYRIALVCDSADEFKRQLNYIILNGFLSLPEQNIFCGKNQVVSDLRQHKEDGDITESEYYMLNERAEEIVSHLQGNAYKTYDSCKELCEIYVSGADINWRDIYSGDKIVKIPLPPYSFEKTHYWGDLKVTKIEGYSQESGTHQYPLLERCLVESMDQSIYLVNFSLNKDWVLQEHKIFDSCIVPGTAYLEICREVFREYYGSEMLEIENFMFFSPIMASEKTAEVETHVIVREEEGWSKISVVSKKVEDSGEYRWIQHAQGRIRKLETKLEKCQSYQEIMSCPQKQEVNIKISGQSSDTTVYLGPRWHCFEHIYKIYMEDGEVICVEIKLQDQFKTDMDQYLYHPSLADGALNFPLQIYVGTEVYLPYTYGNLKIYNKLPSHFYSKVKRTSGYAGDDIMVFDAVFADMEGNILAKINNYAVKKVNKFNDYASLSFYSMKWEKSGGLGEEKPLVLRSGTAVFFDDNLGYADKLAGIISRDGINIVRVSIEKEFKKINENRYTISYTEKDYEQLIDMIKADTIVSVFHLSTLCSKCPGIDLSGADDLMKRGLYSALYLSRAMLKRINHEVDFYMITNFANNIINSDSVNPFNTSYLALTKTLRYECEKFRYRCVELDGTVSYSPEDLLSCITGSGENFRTSYRNGIRYTEVLESVDVAKENEVSIKIQRDGVYVISGGTGGLGLETAWYLSDLGECNICLLGRMVLPDKQDWEKILEEKSNHKLCRLIDRIRKIEKAGSHVTVCNSDITDYSGMYDIFEQLKNDYKKINGIIHCAGVAGNGILLNKPDEVFNSVLYPKIKGALILRELTKDQELDFFVMYSSMQTIFGGMGQGDYTSANAFLDGYADYLKQAGVKAKAINWPGWSETGMAADFNVTDGVTMFETLTNSQGIKGLHSILTHDVVNLVPGSVDYTFLMNVKPSNLPFGLSAQILRAYDRFERKYNRDSSGNSAAKSGAVKFNPEELTIFGKKSDEYTDTERAVAIIYAAVLNLNEIDIYESFNSLGGDSIMATEVFKVLDQSYPSILNISDVFSHPTVEDIAAHIDSLTSSADQGNIESYDDMMDKLDSGEIKIDEMIEFFNN